jgi:hypothetical protein
MAVESDNWLTKTAGPFTENASNEVILTREKLGWPLDGVRTLRLQFDTLAGGNVDVYVWGPLDAWTDYSLNNLEDAVVDVTEQWELIRCVFQSTGGSGRVGVQGIATGW